MRRFSVEYLSRTRDGMWDDREALAPLRLDDCESILDAGCGTGELTRVLVEESDARVVGADRDRSLLAHRRREVARASPPSRDDPRDAEPAPAVRGDVRSLPFPDDAFDLVACQALLVNLPDPDAAIREFARVARERVAVVEPDNGAVSVESTVGSEAALAARARERYVAGVDTDVTLGTGAADLLGAAGLSDVRVRRHDHERTVEPPYSEREIEAATRKASGAALRERRAEMVGTAEELDALRSEWRAMGREVVRQVRDRDYRRREVVPFYVVVGEVSD